MAKDLQFRHYETLYNLLKMYSREPEEVLIIETVTNGMDAKAIRELTVLYFHKYINL